MVGALAAHQSGCIVAVLLQHVRAWGVLLRGHVALWLASRAGSRPCTLAAEVSCWLLRHALPRR